MTAAAADPPRERGPFSPVAALWLVLVGALSFVGLLILTAYAPQLRGGGADGGGHALSRSALGYAGIVQLLKAQGERVIVSRGPMGGGRTGGLVVYTPTAWTNASEIEDIETARPKLIVLPKWQAAPHMRRRGWVQNARPIEPEPIAKGLLAPYVPKTAVTRREAEARPRLFQVRESEAVEFLRPAAVRRFQTFSGDGWQPLIVDERGGIVLGRVGRTYVLSDPDLMNTHGIKDLATARVAVALLKRFEGPIVFDVTLHGYTRERNFLRLMFEPPFLGVTLCFALAALLMAFHAAARFGPAMRPPRAFALGKGALADNTAGLIRMARREHKMAERYALAQRVAVARAIGAPRDLDEAGLNAFLDRLSGMAGLAPFTDLLDEARRASNPGALIAAARKLHHWRVEMTRERH